MIRLRSLRRATVLVLCAILLTVVQTVMSLAWRGVWRQVVAAVLVAGITAAAELERHIQEQEEADAQADGRLPPVALAAERLAVVVRDAWTAEARRRGVTTPAPASVRWRWGSSEVAVPKDEIVSPAGGVGPGVLPAPRIAGGEAGTLLESGVVTRLHDEVYARLPHGRLVILGEAGAGKTGAMLLLLLQALEHREGFERAARLGVPVPVWLTLGGWDPDAQPFRTWVLTVLDREHPYLRSAAFGSDAAQTLLASGHLALFLDGLDEMPAAARSAALRQLDAETANFRVVLTSRPQEYREALDQGRLHSAAVIEIRPVRPTVAASYLVRGEVGVRRDVWASVGDYLRLHPDSVPARALSTPLALSLARFAYQHSDPAELVAQGRFASPGDLREHLVGGVLEAAYPDAKQRDRAIRWLSWAAHRMGDSRDLGWWHLATWIPRWKVQPLMAFVAVFAGSVTTFAGLAVLGAAFDIQTFAVPAGRDTTFVTEDSLAGRAFINEFVLPLGAALGLAAWWASLRANSLALRRDRPARLKPRLPRPREYLVLLRTVALSAVGLGILVGLLAGFGPLVVDAWDRAVTDGLGAQVVDRAAVENALQVALASGLGVGVAAGLVIGLFRIWSIPSDDAVAASPRSTYAGDRRARLAVSLLAGAAVGLSVGVLVGAVYGARSGLVFGGYAAVVVAVVFRVVFGLSTTLWFAEYVEHAPRLFPLLEDALERQVLRQTGSVYQFRHAELQDHLARAYLHGHRDVALRTGRLRGLVETAAVGAARTVRRALQPPRRRPVLIATGAVAVGATAVVLAPAVGAMLRPDHDTLTDTQVEALAFSPDGDVLATSGDGKTVLWDVERREVLHELTGELVGSSSIASSVNAGAADLAFSRNGDFVATADGPVVRWWDVAEGRELSSGSARCRPAGDLLQPGQEGAGHRRGGNGPCELVGPRLRRAAR